MVTPQLPWAACFSAWKCCQWRNFSSYPICTSLWPGSQRRGLAFRWHEFWFLLYPNNFFCVLFPTSVRKCKVTKFFVRHIDTEMLCIQKPWWFYFGIKLWIPGCGAVVHKRCYCVRELRVLLRRGGWPPYPNGSAQLLTSTLLFIIRSWLLPCAGSACCQTPPYQFTKSVLQAGVWESGLSVGRGGGGINNLLSDILLFWLHIKCITMETEPVESDSVPVKLYFVLMFLSHS